MNNSKTNTDNDQDNSAKAKGEIESKLETNDPNLTLSKKSTLDDGMFPLTKKLSKVPLELHQPTQSVCLVGKAGLHLTTKAL